jgi:hypothetical protein
MFNWSQDDKGSVGFYHRGLHFYALGWEWDIGCFYFRRWR